MEEMIIYHRFHLQLRSGKKATNLIVDANAKKRGRGDAEQIKTGKKKKKRKGASLRSYFGKGYARCPPSTEGKRAKTFLAEKRSD